MGVWFKCSFITLPPLLSCRLHSPQLSAFINVFAGIYSKILSVVPSHEGYKKRLSSPLKIVKFHPSPIFSQPFPGHNFEPLIIICGRTYLVPSCLNHMMIKVDDAVSSVGSHLLCCRRLICQFYHRNWIISL